MRRKKQKTAKFGFHLKSKNGKIPILTTKKTAWKTCLKELLWFIKGETDNNILQNQNVHIWDGNASQMPKGSGTKIDDCSIKTIELWINQGRKDN